MEYSDYVSMGLITEEEVKKYKVFLNEFFHCYKKDPGAFINLVISLRVNENILSLIPDELAHQIVYANYVTLMLHNYKAIDSFRILLNKNILRFNYDYCYLFNILASSCIKFDIEITKEINKYSKVKYEIGTYDIKNGDFIRKHHDADNNIEYNLYILTNVAAAYCYYNSEDPSLINEMVGFFIKNYEQIMNSLYLNNLMDTKRSNDLISEQGFMYFITYFNQNRYREFKEIR